MLTVKCLPMLTLKYLPLLTVKKFSKLLQLPVSLLIPAAYIWGNVKPLSAGHQQLITNANLFVFISFKITSSTSGVRLQGIKLFFYVRHFYATGLLIKYCLCARYGPCTSVGIRVYCESIQPAALTVFLFSLIWSS